MDCGDVLGERVGVVQGGEGAPMDAANGQDHAMAGNVRGLAVGLEREGRCQLPIVGVNVDEEPKQTIGISRRTIQAPSRNLVMEKTTG